MDAEFSASQVYCTLKFRNFENFKTLKESSRQHFSEINKNEKSLPSSLSFIRSAGKF